MSKIVTRPEGEDMNEPGRFTLPPDPEITSCEICGEVIHDDDRRTYWKKSANKWHPQYVHEQCAREQEEEERP